MPDAIPDNATPGIIFAVIVLAAGEGTRMRSSTPKVLHQIAGRPLLWHALRSAAALSPTHLVAVLGHGREQVQAYLAGATDARPVRVAVQAEQHGTGHAVECALATLPPASGTVIVTYGDVPLLRPETLAALATEHQRAGNAVTVLTARVANPSGYGRIVRDESGAIAAIVEHADVNPSQRAIDEINTGVYAFDGEMLADALTRVTAENAKGERYLTDVVGLLRREGRPVGSIQAADPTETGGVNDRAQLAEIARRLNARLVREAQLSGVTILDPVTTWLHADVTIGRDSEIRPATSLEAGTVIGSGCTIGPDSTLSNCRVADGASVVRSHCIDAQIGSGADVGPFSYLRPGAVLAEHAKVGAFCEVKASTVGPGSKVPHLSYVGDTTIGRGVNVGAGTITANYDGVAKHHTNIGDHSFVGSDSTLIAPVTLGPGSYVAAGSTITEDVAAGDLGIARGRQRAIHGWVAQRHPEISFAADGKGHADAALPTDGAASVDGTVINEAAVSAVSKEAAVSALSNDAAGAGVPADGGDAYHRQVGQTTGTPSSRGEDHPA